MIRLRSTIGMPVLAGLTTVSILLACVMSALPMSATSAEVPVEPGGMTVGEAVEGALEHAAASSPVSLDGFLAAFAQAYAEQFDRDDAPETETAGSMNAGDVFRAFWQGHRSAPAGSWRSTLLSGSSSSGPVSLALSRGDAAIQYGVSLFADVQYISQSRASRLVSFVLSVRSVWSAEPLGP